MYKYRKHQDKSLIYAGFAILLLGLTYLLIATNYSLWIFERQLIAISISLFYVVIIFPIAVLFFYYLLTEIKFFKIKKRQLVIRLFAIITSLLFEIYVFYAYFTDPTLLGEFIPPAEQALGGIPLIYMIYAVLVFCIGGIVIGIEGIKSNLPDVKLKGKFLLIAFIIFLIATIIDPFSTAMKIRILDLIVTILQALAAIFFYFGFILPDWLKKYLLKSE